MIAVNNTIKNDCNKDTLSYREYIIINNTTVDIEGKLEATAYKDTTFFGTFNMKMLKFEAENSINYRNKEFEYYKEINGNSFKIGKFVVTDISDNDTTETVDVVAYDYALRFANKYETNLNYESGNITLIQVLQEICNNCGVQLQNTNLPNGSFIVENNQFVNDEAYGDVVSHIALINGMFATINNNDKLELIFKNETNEVIEDYIELDDKRDTQPITSVLIATTEDLEGAGAIRKDQALISQYGEHWLKIYDYGFAYSTEKCNQLIDAVFNQVKGFGYSSFKSEYSFKPYMTLGDTLKFKNKNGELINSILLRYNTDYDEVVLEAPSITSSSVQYDQPESEDSKIKKIGIKVDQANNTINQYVSDIQDITYTQETPTTSTTNITNALNKNAISNVVYGNSQQDTRSGKNLLPNQQTSNSTTINGITFTKQNNGLLVNGTSTANADYYLYGSVTDSGSYLNFTKGAYKIHTNNITGTNMTYVFREKTGGTNFETSSNTQASTLMNTRDTSFYGICIRVNSGKTLNNVLVEPMIETGSTSTSYEQYGIQPSPDYPSEIRNVGVENLFKDKDIKVSQTDTYHNVNVKPNKTYTISFTKSRISGVSISNNTIYKFATIRCFNSSGTAISNISSSTLSLPSGSTNIVQTFTTPANTSYIGINFGNNNGDTNVNTLVSNIMLEKGSVAHPYIPNYDYIDYSKITTYNVSSSSIIENGWRITKGDSLYSGLNLSSIANELTSGTYTLSYKLKKVNGTLFNVGGHTIYNLNSFYIDGVIQNYDYYTPAPIIDDTNEHYITYTFTIPDTRIVSSLYIQANRGYEDSIVFDVYDIHLTSGDEKNIHYGKWVVEDIVGKNILQSYNNSTTYGVSANNNNDGSISISGTSTNANVYDIGIKKIDVKDIKNGTYTFSLNNTYVSNSVYIRLRKYNGTTKTQISYFALNNANKEVSLNLKSLIDSDTTLIEMDVCFFSNGTTFNFTLKPQIELGNSTEYEAYKLNQIQYSLNGYELNKIGNIQDEIDLVSGVLTRRIGKINLVGTESWNFVNQTSYMRSYLSIDNISTTTQDSAISPILCSAFKSGSYNSHLVNTITARYNNAQINIFHNIATSNADFKTWLSNNNVVVYYILNEPETIQLNEQDILLFKDINNISFESNVEPTYKIGYYYGEEKEGTEALQSSLELTSTGIVQQVSRGDIISTINQSAEEVKIDANKINISGVLTAMNNDTTTVIDGGKIKTGSITANQIEAGSITGDKIEAGSITSQEVDSSVITTDNLSAQTINCDQLNGGTIDGQKITGGSISITKGNYSFSMGTESNHPKCSGINVGSGGVNFTANNVGLNSSSGTITAGATFKASNFVQTGTSDNAFYGDVYIYDSKNLKVNRITPGGLLAITTGGRTGYGTNASSMYLYSGAHITLNAAAGNYVYIGNASVGNTRAAVDSSGPSSRILKKDITEFDESEYKEALDLLKDMKLYDYKYKYNIHPKKDQFGFIIDDLLEDERAKKFFYFKDEVAGINQNNYLDYSIEENSDMEKIEFKRYDEETLIKYLLVCNKALLQKVESLEKRIEEMEK